MGVPEKKLLAAKLFDFFFAQRVVLVNEPAGAVGAGFPHLVVTEVLALTVQHAVALRGLGARYVRDAVSVMSSSAVPADANSAEDMRSGMKQHFLVGHRFSMLEGRAKARPSFFWWRWRSSQTSSSNDLGKSFYTRSRSLGDPTTS